AINKDIATPILNAGTNKIREISAEVLDIKRSPSQPIELELQHYYLVRLKSGRSLDLNRWFDLKTNFT
ncbi:MAG: hypothetical protein AAFO85_22125, partial [Cyanobacteria bacterium J06598_4]